MGEQTVLPKPSPSGNDESNSSSPTIVKKKFKSQSVNNLFKPATTTSAAGSASNSPSYISNISSLSTQTSSTGNSTPTFLHGSTTAKSFPTLGLHTSESAGATPAPNTLSPSSPSPSGSVSLGSPNPMGQSKTSTPLQVGGSAPGSKIGGGIKTLSLQSGQKLKIIPEKRLMTPMGGVSSANSGSSSYTSRLINEDNNYWKKSRSSSPDIKKEGSKTATAASKSTTAESHAPVLEAPKSSDLSKQQSSRFTFANLSLPATSSGFNWADIDDEEDDSFNDKIWSSLAPQLEFPNNPKSRDNSMTSVGASASTAADQAHSILSPNLESNVNGELFSPLVDHSNSPVNAWNNSSPLGFTRNSSLSLNFGESGANNSTNGSSINDTNNGNHRHSSGSTNNNSGNFYQAQNRFGNKFHGTSLSSSFDKLSFQDTEHDAGSEPVKQELFNPLTGKIEVFSPNQRHTRLTPHLQQPHHHHSFDSSYINHNTASTDGPKAGLWKSSNTVWNSRENSLTNNLPQFSPNLGSDTFSSPGWSHNFELRNNSFPESSTTAGIATTPNTLRGASRFFPSPRAEGVTNDYFPAQPRASSSGSIPVASSPQPFSIRSSKRHPSESRDPLSSVAQAPMPLQQSLQTVSQIPRVSVAPKTREFEPRSMPAYENSEEQEEEVVVTLPRPKKESNVSTSKDALSRFVLDDAIKHPEGFSSTFYKRGVNNFMFVRELQSKVAINKIYGYDYAEFRINIPISSKSVEKLMARQDADQPSRIKRSYIINIDVRELEGRPVKRPFQNNGSNSGNGRSHFSRSGFNRDQSSRRGRNSGRK